MYVRKRLDIGWLDLTAGTLACAAPGSRSAAQERLEETWSPLGEGLACLSVRTGFDLYLRARRWPAGSEILMTALNIPDMVRIIEGQDLVPVAVDLDLDTLLPSPEDLERSRTTRTRAILVAHLFGSRSSLEAIVDFARENDLVIIEDCAQAFVGSSFTGHPEAEISLFSFGPIKTATALGGALLTVRDPEVLAEMRRLREEYPVQTRRSYLRKLIKYGCLKAISTPLLYGVVHRILRSARIDVERLLHAAARGFSRGELFEKIRRRCSRPLLHLLRRRLAHFDASEVEERRTKGCELLRLLPSSLTVPGRRAENHTFWVFPILPPDPVALIVGLQETGFDAARLATLEVVPGRRTGELRILEAFDGVTYLPFFREIPTRGLHRLAKVLRTLLGEEERVESDSLDKSR